MSSRAWLAVVIAAVVFGGIGYYYGKIRQQADEPLGYAAGRQEPARAAPPQVQATGRACLEFVTLTYSPATASAVARLDVDKKPVEVEFPKSRPGAWAICWNLLIKGNDPEPFAKLELVGVEVPKGKGNQSVLKCVPGGCDFLVKGDLRTFFNDEPLLPRPSPGRPWLTIPYSIDAALANGKPIVVDPDIVIKG